MIKQLVFSFLILITTGSFAQDLTATQTVPSSVAAGSSYTTEVTINRGSINGFMKFFQELPPGFVATEIDSKGGSFSFADNGAKIVWIAPPNEATYTISFKVTVPADASGSKSLPTKFSYIHNNERKIFEFEPKSITIEGPGGSVKTTSLPVVTKAPTTPATKPTPVAEKPTTPVASSTSTKPASVPAANPPVKTGNMTPTAPVKETTPAAPATTKAVVPTTPAPTVSGKTYRVQIGAFSAKPKLSDVGEITTIVLDNGVTKYFSGNFTSMEEATKRKEEVAKKGFPGAFVVAFENGKIVK
ncbi:MAG TPA: SPOR domain-containing protein [Bacteroidia bacterium]|jgi:hypothetical protein|nr:SPOR domain-containing protein [Bacteroidia bacterium]